MKKLCVLTLSVVMMFSMVVVANAVSLELEPVQEEADTSLTVVFGAPAEFDAVPAAKSAEPVVKMASRESVQLTTTNEPASQRVPEVTTVPEPSTLVLLGLGVLGLLGLARRKNAVK